MAYLPQSILVNAPWAPLLRRLLLAGLFWLLLTTNGAGLSLRRQQAWYGAAWLAFVLWVGWLAWRRRGLPRTGVDAPLAACLLVAAMSALLAPNQQLALQGLVMWATLAAVYWLLATLLLGGWRASEVLEALLALSGLLLLAGLCDLWRIYAGWWQVRVDGLPLAPQLLRVASFVYPTQLAGLIALLVPLVLVLLWRAHSLVVRLLLSCWLLAAALVLWGTASRGGWLAAIVAAGLALAGVLAQERWRAGGWRNTLRKNGWLLALCVLALALLLVPVALQTRAIAQSRGGVAGLTGRQVFWSHAWQMFQGRPLSGWGLDTYAWRFVYDQPSARSYLPPHAHNLALSLLAEVGVLGALAYTALIATGALLVVRRWRVATVEQRWPLLALAASWSGFLLYYAFDMAGFELMLAAVLITGACLCAAGCLRWPQMPLSRGVGVISVVLVVLVGFVLAPQLTARAALATARAASWQADEAQLVAALATLRSTDPAFAARYPELPAYLVGRAAAFEVGPWHGLDAQYAAALAAQPGNAVLRVDAALLLGADGPQPAQVLLAEAARLDPGWPLPHLLLAQLHEQAGDTAAANAAYGAMLVAAPTYARTLACQSSILCRDLSVPHRQLDVTLPGAAAQLQGNLDALPWLEVAEASLARNRLDEVRYALAALGSLDLEVQPGLRERYNLLWAALHERTGNPQAALAALRQVPAVRCCYPASTGPVLGPFGLRPLPIVQELLQTSDTLRLQEEEARLAQLLGE